MRTAITVPYSEGERPVGLQEILALVEREGETLTWFVLEIELSPVWVPGKLMRPVAEVAAWACEARVSTTERYVMLSWGDLTALASDPVLFESIVLVGMTTARCDDALLKWIGSREAWDGGTIPAVADLYIEAFDRFSWTIQTSDEATAKAFASHFPNASVQVVL